MSDWPKIIGESMILASLQSSLGSVEMSSKFSVINFSKDQETLNNALKALQEYFLIATIWLIGTSAVLYSQFGIRGAFSGIFANGIMLGWIVISYMICFRKAAKKYGLITPSFFG
jgi:hypothetical protein